MKKLLTICLTVTLIFMLSSCKGIINDDLEQNQEVEDISSVRLQVTAFQTLIEETLEDKMSDYDNIQQISLHNSTVLDTVPLDITSLDTVSERYNDLELLSTYVNQAINQLDYYYTITTNYVEGERSEYPLITFKGYVNEDFLYSGVEMDYESSYEYREVIIKFYEEYFVLESFVTRDYNNQTFSEYFVLDTSNGYTRTYVETGPNTEIQFEDYTFETGNKEEVHIQMVDNQLYSSRVDIKNMVNNVEFVYQYTKDLEHYTSVIKYDSNGRRMLEYTDSKKIDLIYMEFSLLHLDGWNKLEEGHVYLDDDRQYRYAYDSMEPVADQLTLGILIPSVGYTSMSQTNFETVYATDLVFNGDYTHEMLLDDLATLNSTMLRYPTEDSITMFDETFDDEQQLYDYFIGLYPEKYQEMLTDLV